MTEHLSTTSAPWFFEPFISRVRHPPEWTDFTVGGVDHRTILDGLWFGEGPRWHEGALWLSDMHGHRVVRTDLDGRASTVLELPDDVPSGLGWLPDGRLLVVATETRRLHRLEPDGALSCAADDLASPNGPIITPDGRTLIVAESGDAPDRGHAAGVRRTR